jgi:hypothetical protein
MNKKICIYIFSFLSLATAAAKELKYPVSEIPANLKENAHTVMRIYQQEVEIKSEKSVIITITEVRTILNKNGEDNSYFRETYDPMDKITGLKGKVYDEQGKQIRSFGSDDIIDRSSISGFSMYEDNRVKIIDPKCKTFPFTVEYTYQIESKQTLFFPAWSHGSENISYENSSYIVKAPSGYSLRYKEYNLPKGVVKTNQDGKDVYTWTLNNLKARINEPMSSIITPDYPLVLIAPSNFSFAETKGSAESWKELGKWATTLIEGKDKLSETTITKMREIVKDCKTDFEKVKRIYEYMQQKTRYVNISVGIGGWQPFDAMVVDKFSYGDCKALSNYTKALLSAVGINSYYTLVRAGAESNSIDESFPSSHFNHVIVCVPLSKDTIWLECTNQRMPCGYNGDFTDDRQVLLIDGENSKLVRTRAYSASENYTERHSNINLINEQSATAEVKTIYKGLSYDNILPAYYADDADKKKIVTQSIQLPSFSLDQFSYKENKNMTPSFEENLNISCTNYIHKLANDVVLLPVNFMNKLKSIPEKIRNRKTSMCIRRPQMEIDTTVYKLPARYQVTELPEKFLISSKFGKYTAHTIIKDNLITYIRLFEQFKGTFPPEAYAEYRDFLEQVSTADEAVVSLKKQSAIAQK